MRILKIGKRTKVFAIETGSNTLSSLRGQIHRKIGSKSRHLHNELECEILDKVTKLAIPLGKSKNMDIIEKPSWRP